MSFVSLDQKSLQRVLTICNQISPKKSDIDIFTYTKIDISKDHVVFSAINQSVYYHVKLKPNNLDIADDSLSFLVKTDLIANSASLILDDQVGLDINLDKLTLLIQGSKTKHTLRIDTASIGDFVTPKENPEDVLARVMVNTQEMLDAVRIAQTSVGNPKSIYQPELLTICLTLKTEDKQMLVVSTDRYRLSKTSLVSNYTDVAESVATEPSNFLTNPRSMGLLAVCLDEEESMQLNFEKDYLWVKSTNSTLTMRYGEGKYPDYEKIVPQSFGCTFVMNTKDALSALKQVYFFARTNIINKNVNVLVDPSTKKVTFTAKTDDGNSSESTVDIDNYEGIEEQWNQSFNADYLIDYIGVIDTDNFLWEANPGKPSVLSPEKEKSNKMCLISGIK